MIIIVASREVQALIPPPREGVEVCGMSLGVRRLMWQHCRMLIIIVNADMTLLALTATGVHNISRSTQAVQLEVVRLKPVISGRPN
jgi:hypothetical protein